MSQRCWPVGIRPTGSRCREQRSGRCILPRVRPGDPPADVMFGFALARFYRKLVERLRKKGLLPAILLHGGQLDASADESEEIHTEPPAYTDDFFLPVVSDPATDLLPRVALATQVVVDTAREHGLRLNMASNRTGAVVEFRGKGRQQVLEELAVEFPVVDGQWTPTVKVADGVSLTLISTYRHLGTQASHGARRGPELAARRSAAKAAYQATRKKIPSQRRLSKKARVAVARAVVSSRLLYGAGTWHSLSALEDINAMEDTYMALVRTIAYERWRLGYVPASSQEVFRRFGFLVFWEAVSLQRLRLAARPVNASPSLMAQMQSDEGRAWKAELSCDIELLRQEKGVAACGGGRPSQLRETLV